MRGGAGDVLDHGERPASFALHSAASAALDEHHEGEPGLLRSFFEPNALLDSVVSDDELASLQSVE